MVRIRYRFLCIFTLLWPVFAPAEAVLTTISEVRAMMPDEVEGEIPVDVEAQILCLRKQAFATFLHDGINGIYMSHRQAPEMVDKLQVGDWIRVKGIVEPGGFSPGIFGHEIEIIDHLPLPAPGPYDADDRNLATMDCQWISIKGLLVDIYKGDNPNEIMATVEDAGKTYHIQARSSAQGVEQLTDLMFREVEMNAIVATLFNQQQQGVGRSFIVNSTDDIVPVHSSFKTTAAPLVPLSQLMRKDSSSYDMVRTGGIVTGALGNDLFLRGAGAALRVHSAKALLVEPGDYVEVVGYVWPQPVSPAFRAMEVIKQRTQAAPVPQPITHEDIADETLNYELVQLKAQLLDIGKSFSGSDGEQQTLLCRSGAQLFEARMPSGMQVNKTISVGAELQLTGFAHFTPLPYLQGVLKVNGLWLQLRGPHDVQLLRAPPWWTPKRITWALASLAGILALVVGWVILLRRTVNRQTGIIGNQVEREAVLNERQRIARELHDSLEQGLAGIAIQLKACDRQQELNAERLLNDVEDAPLADQIQLASEGARTSIKVAQEMLVHCNEESRSTILELRSGLLERTDLHSALKMTLEPLVRECGAELDLSFEGASVQLERPIERNLLLIAKEAVTNAVRHASPNNVILKLNYAENQIRISVQDDGRGFDVKTLASSDRLGVQGMRERVSQLTGHFEISSSSESGTSVMVEIPLRKDRA